MGQDRGGEGVVGGVDFEDLRRGDGVAAADELQAFELMEGAVVGAIPADAVAGEGFEDGGVDLDVLAEGVAEGPLLAVGEVFSDGIAGVDEVELEGLGFGELDAAELPDGEDDAGGEFELDGAAGGEVVEEIAVEGFEIGVGFDAFEDGGVGVEAVFEGVGADGGLAGAGGGAGGSFGVAAVGRELGMGWHKTNPFENVVGRQGRRRGCQGRPPGEEEPGPGLRLDGTTEEQGAGALEGRKWLKRKERKGRDGGERVMRPERKAELRASTGNGSLHLETGLTG